MEIGLAILGLLIGLAIGAFLGKKTITQISNNQIDEAKQKARDIINQAQNDGENQKRERLKEAKEKYQKLKEEHDRNIEKSRKKQEDTEKQLKQRETTLAQRENTLGQKENSQNQRENMLNQKESAFLQKEKSYDQKVDSLQKKENEVDKVKDDLNKQLLQINKKQEDLEKNKENLQAKMQELEKQKNDFDTQLQKQLEKIAGLTAEDAKRQLVDSMIAKAETEAMAQIKLIVEETRLKANKEAKKIIIQTIQRTAAEHTIENTVSVFPLESDDIKGQIIGREGRNIRALEAATGVEIIVDDTPEAIVISGYDPVRREIARLSLQKLVTDGRIHPARIEEVVAKTRKQIEQQIIEIGERTVIDLNIHGMQPELIRMVGRMRYRSSYGQNLLQHSIETAKLCAIMASELGLTPSNVKLAKRAGLLHDIGKVPEEETELSHALLGLELSEKYSEHPAVVNAIGAHHDEIEMTYLISPIVQACDAISGARPGARREVSEQYLRRIEELEKLAISYEGVDKAYAIQAGRELRVIVESEKVTDDQTDELSIKIANRIQTEMQYPGQIKVTVIREKRAISLAK